MGRGRRVIVGWVSMLLGLAAGPAHGDCDGRPWLQLEIIGAEVAAGERIETISVDADGCVASEFPQFDRRSGRHQHRLTATEHEALARFIAASGIHRFDAAAVRAGFDASDRAATRSAGGRLFHLADAETTRLLVRDGAEERVIAWRSPELEYELRGRPSALRPLASVVARLRAMATAPEVPR